MGGQMNVFVALTDYMRNMYIGLVGGWAIIALVTWVFAKLRRKENADV